MIVLDLNLQGKDGLEILQEIRERSKTQKVIILSARSLVPDKILGLDMGANDYLTKPFDFMELEARIRSLARREIVQNDEPVISSDGTEIIQENKGGIDLNDADQSIFSQLKMNER